MPNLSLHSVCPFTPIKTQQAPQKQQSIQLFSQINFQISKKSPNKELIKNKKTHCTSLFSHHNVPLKNLTVVTKKQK